MSQKITVIKGDGVGPDIVDSALQILDKAECDFSYDFAEVGQSAMTSQNSVLPKQTVDLIGKNKVTLKGPLTIPQEGHHKSINASLREHFQLYANLRPVLSFKSTKARYEDIDIITVRDITSSGAEQILTFAYELARQQGRKKVTSVHKIDPHQAASGSFLQVAKEVGDRYPDIESNDLLIENCCMQLVLNPNQFDVLVSTDLFAEILSELSSGLVGGLGMVAGANIGKDCAIFEVVHGSAPSLVGKNLANPTSIILASVQMLEYLNMGDKANTIRAALKDVIESGDRTTRDLGGQHGTTDFTEAVLDRL